MSSASASAPPDDITYYNVPPPTSGDSSNVNAVDKVNYVPLSAVGRLNDNHTYSHLNTTAGQ